MSMGGPAESDKTIPLARTGDIASGTLYSIRCDVTGSRLKLGLLTEELDRSGEAISLKPPENQALNMRS